VKKDGRSKEIYLINCITAITIIQQCEASTLLRPDLVHRPLHGLLPSNPPPLATPPLSLGLSTTSQHGVNPSSSQTLANPSREALAMRNQSQADEAALNNLQ